MSDEYTTRYHCRHDRHLYTDCRHHRNNDYNHSAARCLQLFERSH